MIVLKSQTVNGVVIELKTFSHKGKVAFTTYIDGKVGSTCQSATLATKLFEAEIEKRNAQLPE